MNLETDLAFHRCLELCEQYEGILYQQILKEKNYEYLPFDEEECKEFIKDCYENSNDVADFIKKLNRFAPNDVEFSLDSEKTTNELVVGDTEPDDFGPHHKKGFINIYLNISYTVLTYANRNFDIFFSILGKEIISNLRHEITHKHQVMISKTNLGTSQLINVDGKEIPLFKDFEKLHQLEKDKRLDIYLSNKHEIDAFARQTVGELLEKLSKEEAIKAIKHNDLDKLNISKTFISYEQRFNDPKHKKRYDVFKDYMSSVIYFLEKDGD